MNKMTLLILAIFFALAGCEKESDQKRGSFYQQKNATVYSYEQTEQKLAYEGCVAKHRDNHTEGKCRVPDFLKK